ncbi:unnamed protein product [Zymoseptoria tritici ST99CH_1A5]|uniref:Ubiquitin carboxyl-terminal hydrolase n=1 Tax=Zymoseptoria tritici ST99CH_1A5 TaxID=1276529 RepID=A0A1Y6M031_ZYMTR|nr:unnamed protein product [Zymoseptoria tritici ST99CH_1A5]
MNNSPMGAGYNGQLPHHPRRDYQHAYHHSPQSPIPPNIYGQYHAQQYYGHPPPPPQYRWHQPYPQQHYVPQPPPMQQQPYTPRSPMVVSSQPHVQSMNQVTRHQNPMAPPPQQTQSPRPIPPYMHRPVPAASPSPAPASVPTPVSAHVPVFEPQKPLERTATPPAPASRRQSTAQNPLSLSPETYEPFWPSLPWYSVPDTESNFLARTPHRRRRRRNNRTPKADVALPALPGKEEDDAVADASGVEQETVPAGETAVVEDTQSNAASQVEVQAASTEDDASETSTIAPRSEPETPATSQAPSEGDAAHATTPTTTTQPSSVSPKAQSTQQHARSSTRTAIAIPNIPGLSRAKGATPPQTSGQDTASQNASDVTPQAVELPVDVPAVPAEETAPQSPPPKAAPKSWADLVKRNTKTQPIGGLANGGMANGGFQLPQTAPLAEALKQYNVHSGSKLAFLEPRGLVNTGNMCYMNSILQVLVFCAPFYSFLDQVRQRTVHSMKSDTPLVDAMIMFMREFKVLADAESADTLRKTLKQDQLEVYGDPVTPEYVYEVIRKLPRFASMRRGHQQDAEEFLGFLLEGLHDECVHVMQGQIDEPKENGVTSPDTVTAEGWLEVGPKQKASVTRTAGQQDAPSPVTKIFGGHLRSELRVPGQKDSVTLEPYQPLQLDIGAPHVNNIIDALKGITRTETLTGDFGGKGSTAKKQVFIDTLPPVLILHLKRFQYDNSQTGTQKIWKKVGYPLELEIPKDVFPPAKRGGLAVKGGLPRYRLTGVVYHHGKSAAGGHYTVDVLRQDSREWVRMDDTVIRRIRPEDVAEGGAEEDPKLLAKALEQHKADADMQKQRNMYQGLDEAEKEPEEEKPWSEVNGYVNGHAKKWSNVAVGATNGTATPASTTGKRTPTNAARKEGVRDNKVAYILLYERMRD